MQQDIRHVASPSSEPDPLTAFQDLLDRLVVAMTMIGVPAVLVAMSRAAEFGWQWGASGEAALDYLQTQAVDLLLLDMIMSPGMDGLDTYRAVLDRYPEQKALVVSGFAETERVQEMLRLGATGFIRKPYSVETLAHALRRAVGQAAG
jgi:DNA-binding NarL/FixJ family response regulator